MAAIPSKYLNLALRPLRIPDTALPVSFPSRQPCSFGLLGCDFIPPSFNFPPELPLFKADMQNLRFSCAKNAAEATSIKVDDGGEEKSTESVQVVKRANFATTLA